MGSGVGGGGRSPSNTRSDTEPLHPAASPPPLPPFSYTHHHLPPNVTLRLYLSHLLSTWNSRIFEFGVPLFIANLYPNTLLPSSLYALVRGFSAVLGSPRVGRYVDSGDRLRVVRVLIIVQRVAVVLSCGGLLAVKHGVGGRVMMGVLAVLACCEKLASVGNSIAIERDWVVVVAGGHESALQVLNSQMRRIDLFCKLLSPLAISMAYGISTVVAIYVVLGLNLASVGVEYFAVADVYRMVPALQEPKTRPASTPAGAPLPSPEAEGLTQALPLRLRSHLRSICTPISTYLHHPAALPSLAASILYFTVLSFGSQMITYLLTSGYAPLHISSARGISVLFEFSATWLAPLVMSHMGPIRGGLWFVNWQLLCVAGAVGAFWFLESPMMTDGLILGVILSRVGLWGFDFCAQIIVQVEVEPEYRGSFSAMEASVQSVFELGSYAVTVVFSKPEEFRYPALVSVVAVSLAAGFFASFVRRRRGHLLHTPACFSRREVKPRAGEEYRRLLG